MTDAPTREVWITKYACSKGILHAVCKTDSGGRPVIGYWGLSSKDFRDEPSSAREDAEALRQKKVASLRKQLARLEKIDFLTAPIKEYKR